MLVFTRTKFGANHVAEYLTKHGVTAMALHGNKSQSARTQALAGFKTGELRALVATDIAARGIDIDELPHVVNYEIPNVPEDYVHRIGRTGRAGREGHAVSLVCLDEEGFMMEIERFTKQEIPVQVLAGFGPEEGEKAEPIAMGRQTIWGGAGEPPAGKLQAAAKAARQEMMERIRSDKTAQPNRGGGRGGRKPVAEAAAQASGEGHPTRAAPPPGTRAHAVAAKATTARASAQAAAAPARAKAWHRCESRPCPQQQPATAPPATTGPDYEGGASSRFEFQPPTDAHLGTRLGPPPQTRPRWRQQRPARPHPHQRGPDGRSPAPWWPRLSGRPRLCPATAAAAVGVAATSAAKPFCSGPRHCYALGPCALGQFFCDFEMFGRRATLWPLAVDPHMTKPLALVVSPTPAHGVTARPHHLAWMVSVLALSACTSVPLPEWPGTSSTTTTTPAAPASPPQRPRPLL